jgi:hypothetical protein
LSLKIIFFIVPNLLGLAFRHSKWEAINHKQITRWQHVSRLKASSFSSWKKIIIVKNATAYTWDWYCHLVVDRTSLEIRSTIKTQVVFLK